MRSIGLAAAVLGAAALGFVLWFGLGPEPSAREMQAAVGALGGPAPVDAPSAPRADRAATDVERRAGASPEPVDAAGGRAAAERPGALALRFVDARDGSAVADLAYVVFSERRRHFVAAAGRSDASGCATVDRLPGDAWLVLTERRPPHAATLAAFWLEPGAVRDVTVPVDPGGAVVGRVVDDLGTPVAGVALELDPLPTDAHRLAPRPAGLEVPRAVAAAVTGADGRFRVDALRSHPQRVWIDDAGTARPEELRPVALHLREPLAADRGDLALEVHVESGATVDLGDVVLPRAARLAGRVVDHSGAPLAGALITVRSDRRSHSAQRVWRDAPRPLPWESGFAPGPSETLTDPVGRFELRVPGTVADGRARLEFSLWTADGQQTRVAGPLVLPGESVEDLTVVVPHRDAVVIELFDAEGRRLDVGAAFSSDAERVQAFTRLEDAVVGVDPAFGWPTVFAWRSDAGVEPWSASLRLDPDGVARGRSRAPLREPFEAALSVAGFEPTAVPLLPDGLGGARGRAVLERAPARTLRFEAASAPATRAQLDLRLIGEAQLGGERPSYWIRAFTLRSDEVPLTLELLGPTAILGRVEVRAGDALLASFEALPPRDEPYAVALDFPFVPVGEGEGALPSEPERAPATDPASVRLTVVDARDGSPIEGAELRWFAGAGREGHATRGPAATTDADGRAARDVAIGVALELRVTHPDYEPASLSLPALAPGALEVPPPLALVARPRFTVRVVDEVGRPAADARVRCEGRSATTGADGAVTFPTPDAVDGRCAVTVERPMPGLEPLEFVAWQRWVAPPAPGDVVRVECGPWRVVELRLDVAPRYGAPVLLARPPGGDRPRGRAGTVEAVRVARAAPGASYRCAVGTGPWTALLNDGERRIEQGVDVALGSGAQIVTLDG